MIVTRLAEIEATERDVSAEGWRSRRLLLAGDGMGFSMHDTLIAPGAELRMHYKNHVEAVYCIEGEGEIEDLETGRKHPIAPGTLYALVGHERHVLRGRTQMRMVCVFNPPVIGDEKHGPDGAYAAPPTDGD